MTGRGARAGGLPARRGRRRRRRRSPSAEWRACRRRRRPGRLRASARVSAAGLRRRHPRRARDADPWTVIGPAMANANPATLWQPRRHVARLRPLDGRAAARPGDGRARPQQRLRSRRARWRSAPSSIPRSRPGGRSSSRCTPRAACVGLEPAACVAIVNPTPGPVRSSSTCSSSDAGSRASGAAVGRRRAGSPTRPARRSSPRSASRACWPSTGGAGSRPMPGCCCRRSYWVSWRAPPARWWGISRA